LKKKAVALAYSKSEKNAPEVVAKGKGYLAEKIIELAKKSNIPILQNKELVDALFEVKVGEEIPENVYRAVAAILVYVYKNFLNKSPEEILEKKESLKKEES